MSNSSLEENYSSEEQSGDERALNGNQRHHSDTPPSPSACPSSRLEDDSETEMKPLFPLDEEMSEAESLTDYSLVQPAGKTIKASQQVCFNLRL